MRKTLLLTLLLLVIPVLAGPPVLSGLLQRKPVASGGGTPSFVEEVGRTVATTSGSTTTITLTSSVASGNQVCVITAGGLIVSSITDTAGNSYTSALIQSGGSFQVEVWKSVTGGALAASDTITVTWTTSGFSDRSATAFELSGVTGTDQTSPNEGFTTVSYGSATTTAATVGVGITVCSGCAWTAAGAAVKSGATITLGYDVILSYENFSTSGAKTHGGTLGAASTHQYDAVWFK